MIKLVIIFGLVAGSLSLPALSGSTNNKKISNYDNCKTGDIGLCLKMRALKFIDLASDVPEIKIFDGIKIVSSEKSLASRSGRSLKSLGGRLQQLKGESRNDAANKAIISRVGRFIGTHSIDIETSSLLARVVPENHPLSFLFYPLAAAVFFPLVLFVKFIKFFIVGPILFLAPILPGMMATIPYVLPLITQKLPEVLKKVPEFADKMDQYPEIRQAIIDIADKSKKVLESINLNELADPNYKDQPAKIAFGEAKPVSENEDDMSFYDEPDNKEPPKVVQLRNRILSKGISSDDKEN